MALYIRTDIYDLKEDGVSVDFSSEIAEVWGADWDAAYAYCLRMGCEDTGFNEPDALRENGRVNSNGRCFTICIWDEDDPGEQFADGSEKNFRKYFEQ